jgi:hypothetical protein
MRTYSHSEIGTQNRDLEGLCDGENLELDEFRERRSPDPKIRMRLGCLDRKIRGAGVVLLTNLQANYPF